MVAGKYHSDLDSTILSYKEILVNINRTYRTRREPELDKRHSTI